MTDIRELLIDGIDQLHDWMDGSIRDLTLEQLNWNPDGKTISAGFAVWHVVRTQDNITNFVMQRKTPIWLEQGYVEKFGLPKVEQGTGMPNDDARDLQINDLALLREYGTAVNDCVKDYLKDVDMATLEEVQMIKPLGEMPKWKVFRQVCMTHGFMHLGEVNANKGLMGMPFFI